MTAEEDISAGAELAPISAGDDGASAGADGALAGADGGISSEAGSAGEVSAWGEDIGEAESIVTAGDGAAVISHDGHTV